LVHVDDLVGATLHLAGHEAAVGRAFNVVSGVYPSSHDIASLVAAEFDMEVDVVDDTDAGPSYDERVEVRERMLADGMEPHILLTKERFRFMRKANRNNRLSIDALLGTGFSPSFADVPTAVRDDVAWYRAHRWVI
jgi:nucleoside-diphosphate-sugar epimerase